MTDLLILTAIYHPAIDPDICTPAAIGWDTCERWEYQPMPGGEN